MCGCGDCILCDVDGRSNGPLSLPGDSVRAAISSVCLDSVPDFPREDLSWTDDEPERMTLTDVDPPDGCEPADSWEWCLRVPELAPAGVE